MQAGNIVGGQVQQVNRRSTKEHAQVYSYARAVLGKYGQYMSLIKVFLTEFQYNGTAKYREILELILARKTTELNVSLEDVSSFSKEVDLAALIVKDTCTFQAMFVEAAYSLLQQFAQTSMTDAIGTDSDFAKRSFNEWVRSVEPTLPSRIVPRLKWPLYVRFVPLFSGFGAQAHVSDMVSVLPLREIRSKQVGSLVRMQCVVTRSGGVFPRMEIASYKCEVCGSYIWQTVEDSSYMPVVQCPTPACKTNASSGNLSLHIRTSRLVECQEVKVQEFGSDVPVGSVPRSLSVLLLDAHTRVLLPGDSVILSGVFVPVKETGFAKIKKGNMYEMQLVVHHVELLKARAVSGIKSQDASNSSGSGAATTAADASRGPQENSSAASAPGQTSSVSTSVTSGVSSEVSRRVTLESAIHSTNMYDRLAKSIAPEIYGHLDVKKALLLMLVGGVTRRLAQDEMSVRGDIHVLLMGDPGIAKSQLLKQIAQIASRSVYTTGKGSSGVGLTASVTRDSHSGEVVLEGGALVLADNGVCCIDEFDKMDESDRAAIHEVMEQQTVSIAKAGITTTLNARASVLAAANPVYGRYNPAISVYKNINLPAALLSRFDVQFVLLDRVNAENDMRLARHVCNVHRIGDGNIRSDESGGQNDTVMGGSSPVSGQPGERSVDNYDSEFIRAYVDRAKSYAPVIDEALVSEIATAYVNLRQAERESASGGSGRGNDRFGSYGGTANFTNSSRRTQTYSNLRTLLAILRLSQAHARLRFSNSVERSDFDEALRLIIQAKESGVSQQRADFANSDRSNTATVDREAEQISETWKAIKRKLHLAGKDEWVKLSDLQNFVTSKGFSADHMEQALKEYENIRVVTFNPDRTKICLCA